MANSVEEKIKVLMWSGAGFATIAVMYAAGLGKVVSDHAEELAERRGEATRAAAAELAIHELQLTVRSIEKDVQRNREITARIDANIKELLKQIGRQ